jgi:hypothetical protein
MVFNQGSDFAKSRIHLSIINSNSLACGETGGHRVVVETPQLLVLFE